MFTLAKVVTCFFVASSVMDFIVVSSKSYKYTMAMLKPIMTIEFRVLVTQDPI